MAEDRTAATVGLEWAPRFYDMRLSPEETTEWERLVLADGWDKDAATDEIVRRRREGES